MDRLTPNHTDLIERSINFVLPEEVACLTQKNKATTIASILQTAKSIINTNLRNAEPMNTEYLR